MSLTLSELITTIGEDPVQVRTALELIKKNLTDLTALSQEEVDQALDSLLIRDASTGADKTITVEKLQAALARFGDLFNDFVVSGGLPTTSVDLETDTPATEAYISGLFVSLPEDTARAYTASVDTYVDAGIDGTYSYTEVPNNDPAPAVPADHIRLALVVTDADNITGVTDLRVLKAELKDSVSITTATDTQTLAEALDSRVAYFDTIAERDAAGPFITGQHISVSGVEFKWTGASWVNLSGFITPAVYGAVPSSPDNSDELNQFFAAAGVTKRFDAVYPATKEVNVPFGTRIESYGGGIDFGNSATSGDFPNNVCLRVGGGSLTALPSLSSNVNRGDFSVDLASAPSLEKGDVFLIFNPTTFSYSGFRSNYHAGEIMEVATLSGTTINIFGTAYADYAVADVDLYKIDGGSFNVAGDFEVSAPTGLDGLTACRLERVLNSDISGLKAFDADGTCLSMKQCYNVSGTGLECRQQRLGAGGTNYGLSVANCQKIRLSGDFKALRHSSTIGGFGDVGSVVNRDIKITGSFYNVAGNSIYAADIHGNAEYVHYDGVFNGGVITGGNHNKFSGKSIAGNLGVAITASELSGFDHDFSGMHVQSDYNSLSVSRGVIDIAGNDSNTLSANTTEGGVLNLSGITLSCPGSERPIRIANRGSTADLDIDLSNMKILKKAPGGVNVTLQILLVSGSAFRYLNASDYKDRTGGINDIASGVVTNIEGFNQSGTIEISIDTSTSTKSAPVSFPFGIAGGDGSIVICTVGRGPFGGVPLVAGAQNPTDTGFTVHLTTGDGSLFAGSTTVPVYWRAEAY